MKESVVSETPLIKDPDRFKVGTLTYTKAGLVALFAWLLWGDFCFTLHGVVVPAILPLTFNRYGAPKFLTGLLLTAMPALLNFTLNPIISTASDRTRTRWGRRIPYLALSAPVNALFLILLAFSEDIGRSLSHIAGWAPSVAIVATVAVCFAMFRMTDLFVGTVYWYLFNDVVPKAFLSRFATLFRIVGVLGGAVFYWFLYPHAETHMREIFLGAGILYMFGYTLMCLKVKEGEYPPPPEGMDRRQGLAGLAKTYLRECFFHRFYWLFCLFSAAWSATSCSLLFSVFLYRDELGLTLEQIGRIGSGTLIASAILLYPAGILSDRLHPLRFMRIAIVLQCVWSVAELNWLFWHPSPHTALIVFIAYSAVSVPLNTMNLAASFPMAMQLLPKDRFGQFCAANTMVSCVATMAGGVAAGGFIDLMKSLYHGSNFAYRYVPVWQVLFTAISMIFLFLLHREWVKLGGRRNFEPPSPVLSDSEPVQSGHASSPTTEEPVA